MTNNAQAIVVICIDEIDTEGLKKATCTKASIISKEYFQ